MDVATAIAVAVLLALVSSGVSFVFLCRRPASWVKAVDFVWLPLALIGVYATIYQVSSLKAVRSVESSLNVVKDSAGILPSRHCISKSSWWIVSSAPNVSCDDVNEFTNRVNRIDVGRPTELDHMRNFSWEDGDVAAAVNAYNISVRNYASASSGVWRVLFDALQSFGPFLLAIAFGIRISRTIIEFNDERRKERLQGG